MYLRWWCAFLFPLFANCAKKVITSFLCVVCRYILYSIPASLHDVFLRLRRHCKKDLFVLEKKVKAISMRRGRRRTPPGGYDDGTVGNILSTSTTTTTTYKVKRQ